jgi:hypothetical protein
VNSTPQPPTAAGEHFADAKRILAALPLVKRGAERDRHIQVALVHAVLSISAQLTRQRPSAGDHETSAGTTDDSER